MTRVRRKQSPCLLCEKTTYDWDRVCQDCRDNAQIGRRLKEKTVEGTEVEHVGILSSWHLYPSYGKPDMQAADRIREAVLALIGAVKIEDFSWGKFTVVIGATENGGVSHSQDWPKGYAVPVGKAQIVTDLLQAIRDWAAYQYVSGKDSGESFVRKLVNNEIAFNDLLSKK